MTTTLLSRDTVSDDEVRARWESLSDSDRQHHLAAFWLLLDPAEARIRFAAAVGLLALVYQELETAQATVDACRPLCALPETAGAR